MNLVIDYFFTILSQVWSVVYNNWIIGIFFLISILGFIVDLVNKSREK